MPFDNMTKDDLIVFLTDALLWRGSVSGEIKFGTDVDDLHDLEDRARPQNDEFNDLINRVIALTGREIKPDPRDILRWGSDPSTMFTKAERDRSGRAALQRRAKAEAEWDAIRAEAAARVK